jgi:hypothetical protein
MGTSLALTSPEANWLLSISRLDGGSDPRFMTYQGTQVTAADVASTFLPNWEHLSWQQVADSMFSNSKSCAGDVAYTATISARRGSPLSHQDVIAEFEAFMSSCL